MDQQAQDSLTKHKESVNKYLQSADIAKVAANTYSYDCMVAVAGVGGNYLNVDFKEGGSLVAQFQGGFAPGVGGYVGWGKAWLNTPVHGLKGKAAGFTIELVGVLGGTAHVQIFGDGILGACSTVGVGIGAATGAGGGAFK
jgi:hypothetical protein